MAPLRLDALTADHCEQARLWRNEAREGLRTPYPLSADQQRAFYEAHILKPDPSYRYFAVTGEVSYTDGRDGVTIPDQLLAMVGLTGISLENRIAEISLITDPARTRQGIGSEAVGLILGEAFDRMGLLTVFGEAYCNNPAIGFWFAQVAKYQGSTSWLPRRKFWGGQLWDSLYFTFSVEAYRRLKVAA